MNIKTILFALLSFTILSCSSDDDSSGDASNLPEVFKLTIDKDTPEKIVVNINDPDSQSSCVLFDFIAPDTQNNNVQITNLSFYVPREIVINRDSIDVGETVLDDDLGPIEWSFTVSIDGIDYEATLGTVSITKYDHSNLVTNGGPLLISGVLDVEVTEIGASQTRTVLLKFKNVRVSYVQAC